MPTATPICTGIAYNFSHTAIIMEHRSSCLPQWKPDTWDRCAGHLEDGELLSQSPSCHLWSRQQLYIYFFKILFVCLFVCLFVQRWGKEGEIEGEKQISCLSLVLQWGLGPQPSMCPHQESNWWIFSAQAGSQSTEPHQPGQASSSYRDLVRIGEGKLPLGSANLLCWWQRAVGVGRAALDMRQCSCCSQYGWPW